MAVNLWDEPERGLLKNAVCLYPDAADITGHRVILECDRCPCRMNQTLLAQLCARGFHLYSCVPNTTAITQETDQLFGEFKLLFCKNQKKLN